MSEQRAFAVGDHVVTIRYNNTKGQWPPPHCPGTVTQVLADNRVTVEFATLLVRRSGWWVPVEMRMWIGLLRHADEPVQDR